MALPPGAIRPGAFTLTAQGLARDITLDIQLSQPFTPNNIPSPEPPLVSAKALLDTGSSNCSITKTKAEELGLVPIGKTEVFHAVGSTIRDAFLLNVYLPNRFSMPMVRVTECTSVQGGFDFIIGMEILTLGDLAITNFGGKTVVSFRMPSMKTIDFVQEFKLTETMGHTGRNDPCPCGSKKKYKYCHGK
jgi:hypothetical protein